MTRWLSRLSLLAAVLAAVAAGYLWWEDRHAGPTPELVPEPTFAVADPHRDIGSHPASAAVEVGFPITNTGTRPIRVIGAAPA